MSEPRYKIAYGRFGWTTGPATYSWDEVLAIVRRRREAGFDLAGIIVVDAKP